MHLLYLKKKEKKNQMVLGTISLKMAKTKSKSGTPSPTTY